MTSDASRSAFMDHPTARREMEEDQKTIPGIVFPTTVQHDGNVEPAFCGPDTGEVGQLLPGNGLHANHERALLVWPI
jgi:hypothetical protein